MIDTTTVADLFTEWDIPWAVTSVLALTALIYARGWTRIRRTRPAQFPVWRLAAFLGGMFALFVAVASPLDTFSESLLVMHMAQHFVLMSIAPPLIVLGIPVVPMLRGLPRWTIRRLLRPLFVSRVLPVVGAFLTRPRVAWLTWALALVIWHLPKMYELALSNETIHEYGEHACFFFASLMFWWPVIRPWPGRALELRWMVIPYLVLADVVNTGIAALLCFAGRLLYPSYGAIPRPFGFPALDDQVAAGAFMWLCGSMVYLIPAVAIVAQLLSPRTSVPRTVGADATHTLESLKESKA